VNAWVVSTGPDGGTKMALVVLHASAAWRLPCLTPIAFLPTLAAARAGLALLRHAVGDLLIAAPRGLQTRLLRGQNRARVDLHVR
jgi:hypothetical protein